MVGNRNFLSTKVNLNQVFFSAISLSVQCTSVSGFERGALAEITAGWYLLLSFHTCMVTFTPILTITLVTGIYTQYTTNTKKVKTSRLLLFIPGFHHIL